jgi:hypothetical protein
MDSLRLALVVLAWATPAWAAAQTAHTHVRFSSGTSAASTVHVQSGSSTGTSCEVPCELDVEPTFTSFAVSFGTARVRAPDHARFDLRDVSDTELSVEYEDRSALRIAGWATISVLLSAFGAVTTLALLENGSGCCGGYVLLVIPAPILAGLALAIGLPLGLLNDHLDLREVTTARF